jgi:hypothetical protein
MTLSMTEGEIEDNVRELQAEEFAKQMNLIKEYR